MKDTNKPWAGRFQEATAASVEAFTASVHFDARLYREDIAGSRAHARMLARQGIISEEECAAIVRGLDEIEAEIEAGTFCFRPELEDVHMNIEAALVERIGDAGKKLHTARSRNDQVALDLRLYLRRCCDRIAGRLLDVQRALLRQAETNLGRIMPGYTHLQRAQPVLVSHHLLAYTEMFERDRGRILDCRKRLNLSPLGAAALAGTGLPIDREGVATELGFDGVTANSLDSVADRDFAIEFLAACAIVQVHLSRLAEELVLWASTEFGFVELPDAYCTGSSIMPQKKNPDIPELVRGKTGRVVGSLVSLLVTVKGLPLAYNRDLQEDKEPVFDAADTVSASLAIFAELLGRLRFDHQRLEAAVTGGGFMTATDLADYLVVKGVPFREAHGIVGRAVALCAERGCDLADLPLADLQRFSPAIGEDVFAVLTPAGSANSRVSTGGTGLEAVRRQLEAIRRRLGDDSGPAGTG